MLNLHPIVHYNDYGSVRVGYNINSQMFKWYGTLQGLEGKKKKTMCLVLRQSSVSILLALCFHYQ